MSRSISYHSYKTARYLNLPRYVPRRRTRFLDESLGDFVAPECHQLHLLGAISYDYKFVSVVAEAHERWSGSCAVSKLDNRRKFCSRGVVRARPRAVVFTIGESRAGLDQLAHDANAAACHM